MKKLFALVVLVLLYCGVTAQQLPDLNISFADKSDYKKYEDVVGQVADYILSRPVNDNSDGAKNAAAVLIKWMTGTPDYHFMLDNTLADLTKKNEDVMLPIMASMVSTALHNKDKANDAKEMKRGAYSLFFSYCEKPENKVKLTKEIKSGIQAKNNGELDKYLNI